MNTTNNWFSSKKIILLLSFVGLVYLLVNGLVDNRFNEIELNTRLQIANQQTLLTTIAETTARNGADSITEAIVRDCSIEERLQFDSLLDGLNKGLNHTQLVELERLFGRCGSFFSDRKSVMVSRFSREIEIYENYVSQLGIMLNEDMSSEFNVEKWKSLAAEERKQSEAFTGLVSLQDKIIATLLEGSSADSPEMTAILQEVREVQEAQDFANIQTSKLRSELITL